jgi:hypothetical protein
MEVAIIATLLSTAVSYRAAEQNAAAQDMAADAAEAQGQYNAQINVNNAVDAVAQENFKASAAEANKFRDLEANQRKREALAKKLDADLATKEISMASTYGTFEDTFKAYDMDASNQLASFDFDASESSYQYNLQAGEAGRKRNLAWSQGLAQRDLTLHSAANKATQFRNQADNTRLSAVGTLVGGLGSAANIHATHS